MPIDPSMPAKSIGTLTDLHPDQDLPATLANLVGLRPPAHVEDPAAFSRAMVAFLDQADRRTSPARTSG